MLVYNVFRKVFRNDLYIGTFFFFFSYIAFFLPSSDLNKITSLLFGGAFYLGVMFIGNYITLKLAGFSILSKVYKSAKEKENFMIICCAEGIILSLVAAELGGLWYFPYWSTMDYIVIGFLLGGWTFYILSMIVSYEAGKVILDKILPERKRVTSYYKYEHRLYNVLLAIGLFLMFIVALAASYYTQFFTHFTYNISTYKKSYLPWYYWIIGFVAVCCICEYVEYKKKRSSLLKDILHGYYNPLLAIFAVGFLMAFLNEIQNFDVFLWRYANYPFADITILNVPLFIILTWPLQILAFLTFWRAFGTNASKVLFENDRFSSSPFENEDKIAQTEPSPHFQPALQEI